MVPLSLRWRVLRWLTLLVVTGCGDGITGDWFRCSDTRCAELRDEGLRFRPDETFSVLEVVGSTLEADEAYCELTTPSTNGAYAYDGEMLTTTPLDGRVESVQFALDGDLAAVTNGSVEHVWIRVEPRSTGPCPDNGKR